jgi:hypothetical protein
MMLISFADVIRRMKFILLCVPSRSPLLARAPPKKPPSDALSPSIVPKIKARRKRGKKGSLHHDKHRLSSSTRRRRKKFLRQQLADDDNRRKTFFFLPFAQFFLLDFAQKSACYGALNASGVENLRIVSSREKAPKRKV